MIVDLVAALMWLVVTAYALTGGADFGGGMWDLLAGGARRGAEARYVIERSITPVWESNHVWLVIVLVLLWTGFPAAFGAIMLTLFVPLSIAVFGIILRGSGFALRQSVRSLRYRQIAGALFALSSLITPFFFGAAAGAIVTGRVPATGGGQEIASWTSPTSVTLGLVSVAAFAYLAAVYLIHEAHRMRPAMVEYFSRLAVASGVVTGALAGLVLYELETSAPRIATRLTTGPGLPFLIVSFGLGVAVLVGVVSARTKLLRYLAAGAFTAMLWGWGVAQYPAILPRSLTLRAAAAPTASLVAELVVVGVIALTVAPAFLLLYRLAQRGVLAEEESASSFLSLLQGEESGDATRPDRVPDGGDRAD
jgi:cytochrome bd ubiquinol oxidase subunit II